MIVGAKIKEVFLGTLLLSITALSACSSDSDMTEQRRYEQDFKVAMCIVMEVHVDRYTKDPYKNTFGVQGYENRERVTEMLFRSTEYQLKKTFGYGFKNSYSPNPKVLSFDEVKKNCPETASKFWQIPY